MSAKPSILMIDDEERILRSLSMMFRGTHEVFQTTDPDEFLQIVKNNNITVVISDQRMPKCKGTELLAQVKELSPNSVRILLTGYADLNAVMDSINDGEIYRYITKPWDMVELKATVAKATEIGLKLEQALSVQQKQQIADIDRSSLAKVLIMDERQEVIEKISSHYKNVYQFYSAKTLEEAYDLLAQQDFAVAITDVNFCGEDVTPVIFTLKQIAPALLTIVITTYQDANLLIELINQGQIYRCLPKPVSFTILDKSLERAVGHYHALKANPQMQVMHHTEAAKPSTASTVSSRISGFINRLRGLK